MGFSSSTPELKEKILHHFTWLHRQRDEKLGNARLVRNCFETAINAQASRLATSGTFDTQALVALREEDLITPAQQALEDHRKSRRGYVIKCSHCDATYSWAPELQIIEAICTRCGKNYNCEFGVVG